MFPHTAAPDHKTLTPRPSRRAVQGGTAGSAGQRVGEVDLPHNCALGGGCWRDWGWRGGLTPSPPLHPHLNGSTSPSSWIAGSCAAGPEASLSALSCTASSANRTLPPENSAARYSPSWRATCAEVGQSGRFSNSYAGARHQCFSRPEAPGQHAMLCRRRRGGDVGRGGRGWVCARRVSAVYATCTLAS